MDGRRQLRKDQVELPRPIAELLKGKVSVGRLFELVNEFAVEKRKRDLVIERAQVAIKQVYDGFTPEERVRFFAMLYDQFSDRYDEHMGIETRHYQAIEAVMQYAAPFLRMPMVDLTAGTGEPMKYAMGIIERSERKRELKIVEPLMAPVQDSDEVAINEISERMLAKAWAKLGKKVAHLNGSAYDFSLKGFRTVLCSQTFHLIKDEDKPRLVRAIHHALVPGGVAVVMEEDPFRISPTAPIESVALFIRAIAMPVSPQHLIGYFTANGFTKLQERAVAPIDEFHSMRLHLFEKR
ncbi:Uncharacterised protein [Candidatus Bilamarchaeum dharawalense]|uniref:Methyltransferase domain-containing protein n=1 Tax=Candidatus Bilamarchaeum dharawalense TaxID=2885759 RepID=A0A5E4LMW5_9ARCH|nr:Uncharacterised protein [Candidatus Bilamarchaeum dharawalense]